MDSIGLSSAPRIPRAWYSASITDFLTAEPEAVIGSLTTNSDFAVLPSQRDAWLQEVVILRQSLEGLEGALFLEFSIPRMGRRIDAVVIIDAAVLALEFKVGEEDFEAAAMEQVWDYALDLKTFHEASHPLPIVPILIATEADAGPPAALRAESDGVYRPVLIGRTHLRAAIDLAIRSIHESAIQPEEWARAQYRPTPSLIEELRQQAIKAVAPGGSVWRTDRGSCPICRPGPARDKRRPGSRGFDRS
jgi:hypothetical protein